MRNLTRLAITLLAAASPALPALADSPELRHVLRLEPAETNPLRPPVVTAISLSADGKRLVAGGDDHRLRVWDAETGEHLKTLEGHTDWVRATRFAKDDNRLVSVAADHTVCLWSLTGDESMLSRRLAGGALQAVAWRPDGLALATAGFGDSLREYDLTDDGAEPIERPCACEDTRAVAYSPDGRWLAAAGRNGVVRVWDRVASGPPRDLPTDGRRVRALVFSPGGETLAAGGDGPTLRLWRFDDAAGAFGGVTGAPEELLIRPGKVHALAFLDDNLLSVGGTRDEIRVWDTDTRSPRAVLKGHTGAVAALAASADGRRLVSGSFDTTVRVWDLDPSSLPAAVTASRPAAAGR